MHRLMVHSLSNVVIHQFNFLVINPNLQKLLKRFMYSRFMCCHLQYLRGGLSRHLVIFRHKTQTLCRNKERHATQHIRNILLNERKTINANSIKTLVGHVAVKMPQESP